MFATFYPQHVENILLFRLSTHFNARRLITLYWIVIGRILVFKHINFKLTAKFYPWRITPILNLYQTVQLGERGFFSFFFSFSFFSFFFRETKRGLVYSVTNDISSVLRIIAISKHSGLMSQKYTRNQQPTGVFQI